MRIHEMGAAALRRRKPAAGLVVLWAIICCGVLHGSHVVATSHTEEASIAALEIFWLVGGIEAYNPDG